MKRGNSICMEQLHFATDFALHHFFKVVLQAYVAEFLGNVVNVDFGDKLPSDHRLPTGLSLNVFNVQVIW